MHIRGLVLLLFVLPGGARRSIRVDDSHRDAQQQNNAFANGLDVSAEAQDALIPGGFHQERAPRFRFGPRRFKVARANAPNMMLPETVKCKIRRVATASALAATIAAAPALAGPTVKLGSDSGQLVFDPAEVTISKGDSVTWVNNKGYPHNVIFDEEAVPSGVDVEKLSTPDQLGEEGQKHTAKFDVAGTYEYYCEPHRGAGMQGQVIVK